MPIFENAKKKINNLTKKLLTFENQGDIICTSNGLRTAHGISFQHNTNYVANLMLVLFFYSINRIFSICLRCSAPVETI